MRPEICRRSGDDAVIVFGISLRLHQGLATAVGAACKISLLRIFSVKGMNDGFGLYGHLVDAAISEIDDLLLMSQRPGSIRGTPTMSGVGRCRGIAAPHCAHQRWICDGAGEPTIALALVLAVPSASRHPDLHLDAGIGSRLYLGGNTTKCR